MNAAERDRLVGNIAAAMKSVPSEIQERQVRHFSKADPAYGRGVAEAFGLRAQR